MNFIIRAMATFIPGFNVHTFIETLHPEVKKQLSLRGWKIRGNAPNILGNAPVVAQVKALLIREGLTFYDLLEFQGCRVRRALINQDFHVVGRRFQVIVVVGAFLMFDRG